MRSGEEIRDALGRFVARWSGYDGSERSEAQTFLNELFECYGSDRKAVGATFEDFKSSAGFMDLHWPSIVIFEMKAPTKAREEKHRDQLHRYWRESSDRAKEIPAARYVVLCNFRSFEIWEPGRYPDGPMAVVELADLPARYDTLMFLAGPGQEPSFETHNRALTTEAAATIAALHESLADRSAAPRDEIQSFILQSVWCLFAEDVGLIDGYPLQTIAQRCLADPATRFTATEIGQLFRVLNRKGDNLRVGALAGTRYVNGSLFADPAEINLLPDELRLLIEVAEFDWSQVDPTIFGSLMEGILGRERRWAVGAHYTHEADIMKIVSPTIVQPWRRRIAATESAADARRLLDEFCAFQVLDPACGCGNFLFVAYRELRELEHDLKRRILDLERSAGTPSTNDALPFFPLQNLHGIDIEGAAVGVARLTLWMGQRQVMEAYAGDPAMRAEDALPLVDLSNIRKADALRTDWPDADVIIGNPPFLGSQHLRRALGDEYSAWLRESFGVGIKDYCTYWFRRAHEHLEPGQRAGLVGTNSVSQNRARSVSLDYIAANGGVITDAVSTQKWPGDAKVHVSIVNWVKQPAEPVTEFNLDGRRVEGITTSLRPTTGDDWVPVALPANRRRCFQGPIPVGKGFVLTEAEAQALFGDKSVAYADFVRPYLTGEDIADDPGQKPRRWVIDFAARPLEEAMRYPRALAIVRERVRPERERNRQKRRREFWWQFGSLAASMRTALAPLPRFIAAPRVGKRWLTCWQAPQVLPSDKAQVFAFADDYSMGILASSAHRAWAWAQSSTLKGDLNYTPTSAFMTFPWPDPVATSKREAVAQASRDLLARRAAICLAEQIGLTTLYNRVDEGAFRDLAALHDRLDAAVAACYGWPASAARDDDELVVRLTTLNRDIAQGRPYDPFSRPVQHQECTPRGGTARS